MEFDTTAIYAALLGLWLIVLSARVILYRRAHGVSLGHGDERVLEKRVRAHGNLTEYAPIALILMAFLETQGVATWALHGLELMLLIGRVSHGWALSFGRRASAPRVFGTALTLTMIAISAMWLLALALFA